jgi:uncharacterized protein
MSEHVLSNADQTTATPPVQPLDFDVLVRLCDYDQPAPLDIQQNPVSSHTGANLWSISYVSPKGGRVTGSLILPDGSGPFAGILLLHGLLVENGVAQGHELLLPYALSLAKTGAVVLLIDAPFSRGVNATRPEGPVMFTEADRAEQIQLMVDLRCGVDVLCSRADVDASRLAYIGISYGAAMGGLLAAVERRIKAYLLTVGDGGLVTHFVWGKAGSSLFYSLPEAQQQTWRVAMEPIEPIHFVNHAAPAALFFQAGEHDQAIPKADAIRFQQAGSEPKLIRWYDAGHDLDLDVVALRDAAAWLQTQIGIDAQKLELDFVQ